MLNSRSRNFTPVSIAANVLALQQRGPPISAISVNASETACIAKDLSLFDIMFAFEIMPTAIPKPAADPQMPKSPHDPEGILFPLDTAISIAELSTV